MGGKVWDGCIWLRIEISGGIFERGNKPSVPIKDGRFLD